MIIPLEIKEAVSALDHDVRWRIIELIQKNEKMAYTELLRTLDIKKGSLTYHLNKLMENGIIDNYSMGEFGGSYNSYYQLSRFGKDVIAGILSSIQLTLFVPARTGRTLQKLDFRSSDPKKYSPHIPTQGALVKPEYRLAYNLRKTIKRRYSSLPKKFKRTQIKFAK